MNLDIQISNMFILVPRCKNFFAPMRSACCATDIHDSINYRINFSLSFAGNFIYYIYVFLQFQETEGAKNHVTETVTNNFHRAPVCNMYVCILRF